MRIAIITGELNHHKHLCARLAESHDVRAVLHPAVARPGAFERLRTVGRDVARHGFVSTSLRALGRAPSFLAGWDLADDYRRAEPPIFSAAAEAHASIDAGVIHRGLDPNSPAALAVIADADADVVVCLGGPVYRRPLIDVCGLMLNFHTGVSPVYNGASTINFAFADGNPHLCGGTLMIMSPVVDGGDILAHYLPAVADADTPGRLFMKTVAGAPEMVLSFLQSLETRRSFARSRQDRPIFYYRSSDWTIYQTQRVRDHVRRRTASLHMRDEQILEYWRAADDEEARQQLDSSIHRLLWGR